MEILTQQTQNISGEPIDDPELLNSFCFTKWDEVKFVTPDLLKGIYNYGFEFPSPIQQKSIKIIQAGHDLLAQSQSGTGKTGAFSIGALTRLDLSLNKVQVLILAPTRELTKQIHQVISQLTCNMKDVNCLQLVGGTKINDDLKYIREEHPKIVVGCTGRVLDMINRNFLNTSHVKLLILDETDELLSKNFQHQVQSIFRTLPENVQSVLFSATFSEETLKVTKKFMRNPLKISVDSKELSLEGIHQSFIICKNSYDKISAILNIYQNTSIMQSIIYCNNVPEVMNLYNVLIEENYSVIFIHSNLPNDQRIQNFNDFKSGKFRILISTDVTARGIDIQQVGYVINFDMPFDQYNYLHRIGRAGRWGKKGIAINLVYRNEMYKIKALESKFGINMTKL